MYMRHTIYTLAGLWAVLMLVSFSLVLGQETAAQSVAGLRRMTSFLTWQGGAFVVAIAAAGLAKAADVRGVANVKLAGYLPLAASVFVVGALVALIALRVLVLPNFA